MAKEIVNGLLKALRSFANPPSRVILISEEVFEKIFEAGRNKVDFSEAERQEVATLIKQSIKHLDNCIFELGYDFDFERAPKNLIIRSGIQFMLDDFKHFQTDSKETLEDTFQYLVDTQSIDTFDEGIERWKESNSSPIISQPEHVLRRPTGVPPSHTWWF